MCGSARETESWTPATPSLVTRAHIDLLLVCSAFCMR